MFLIKDDKLVEKYNKIWDKVSSSIKKELDSEPVESVKYLGTKIKSFFFSIEFFFHSHSQITVLQGKGEGISLTPHYHLLSLHRD